MKTLKEDKVILQTESESTEILEEAKRSLNQRSALPLLQSIGKNFSLGLSGTGSMKSSFLVSDCCARRRVMEMNSAHQGKAPK